MKTHVQNPWTRSPQLFVHMSVEEAQQLKAALAWVPDAAVPNANARAALSELRRNLDYAIDTERPHGIKGCMP